jgi:NOL1/NOP2/fmu family ribosome biogenesis protein/precorrin-6B methylase 2
MAEPGERILDLCAAPGGKSTQIACSMQGEGLIVCNEIHPARAKILSENIERMGVCNALVTNETPQKLSDNFREYFDRILVDAPCSGEGMFRKNEDACDEWSPENVENCAARQAEILDCAAEMLKPGGRLVYSTCTFAPAWTDHPAEGLEHTIRLWPHHLKGEGHYLAVLQKAGVLSRTYQGYCRNGVEKGISEKECKEFFAFAEENLVKNITGSFLKFGDQLYRMPEGMPSIRNLKVLRPGLHLGTLKKNRFEPSHALALALRPDQVKHVCNLESDDPQVKAYLNGQTLNMDGEKGWYLVTVDGYSIGWGKLAGGILKNHYPKGLRKNG